MGGDQMTGGFFLFFSFSFLRQDPRGVVSHVNESSLARREQLDDEHALLNPLHADLTLPDQDDQLTHQLPVAPHV